MAVCSRFLGLDNLLSSNLRPRYSKKPLYGHVYITDSFIYPDQKLIEK